MLQALKERREKRREAIEIAKRFAMRLRLRKPKSTVLLYGSYARGDFNVWSDIDVLVVIDEDLPKSPLHRFGLIEEIWEPELEPHIISLKEFITLFRRKNPYMMKILDDAIYVMDNLKVSALRQRSDKSMAS